MGHSPRLTAERWFNGPRYIPSMDEYTPALLRVSFSTPSEWLQDKNRQANKMETIIIFNLLTVRMIQIKYLKKYPPTLLCSGF